MDFDELAEDCWIIHKICFDFILKFKALNFVLMRKKKYINIVRLFFINSKIFIVF